MKRQKTSRLVLLVVGTRPEVVKMVPVYEALSKRGRLEARFVSTGQHREMLDQTFRSFGLKPDYDLRLMTHDQSLAKLTGAIIGKMSELIQSARPAAVLVQGDTATVLGTGIGSFFARTPVGHVEAGLRTYNFEAPWPEEMIRRLTDPLSQWCFAPTPRCQSNLLSEGIPPERIHVTGNTVIDSLIRVRDKLPACFDIEQFVAQYGVSEGFADEFLRQSAPVRLVLVTGHRRESFGGQLASICGALATLVKTASDVGIVYPVHLNPTVKTTVERVLGGHPRIALLPPVAYSTFVWLMTRARIIVSDSGGIQEEAPSLGKPVLVTREVTERPEAVEVGTSVLVGSDPHRIVGEALRLLSDDAEYRRRSTIQNPYGDGRAGDRIAEVLERDCLNEAAHG